MEFYKVDFYMGNKLHCVEMNGSLSKQGTKVMIMALFSGKQMAVNNFPCLPTSSFYEKGSVLFSNIAFKYQFI